MYRKENVLLTGTADVDYQILYRLDVNDLTNVCISHHYTQQLCDNQQFWINKFKQDDLPIMSEPTTLQEWLTLYQLVSQAKTDVRHIMMMKNITKQNEILVFGKQSVLYKFLNKSSRHRDRIKVTIKNIKDEYTYEFYKQKPISISEHDILQFLIKIRYMQLFDDYQGDITEYDITDHKKRPYFVDSNVIHYYSELGGDDYYNNIDTLNVRYGMLETILYLEKNPSVLTNQWYDKF